MSVPPIVSPFFFFNDTATTEIYTLSLHDALPIWNCMTAEGRGISRVLPPLTRTLRRPQVPSRCWTRNVATDSRRIDRKSTRLNSSHGYISYAVFCLKKKKKKKNKL